MSRPARGARTLDGPTDTGASSCSLYTDLSLLHRPNVIAAAAIVCAAVQLGIQLRTAPPPPPESIAREAGEEVEEELYWLEVLNVEKAEVEGESSPG